MSLIDLFPGVKRHLQNDKEREMIRIPTPAFQPFGKGGSLGRKKTKYKQGVFQFSFIVNYSMI